jgi:hypothetical protein
MLGIGASELDQHFKEKRDSHLKHDGCHWKHGICLKKSSHHFRKIHFESDEI